MTINNYLKTKAFKIRREINPWHTHRWNFSHVTSQVHLYNNNNQCAECFSKPTKTRDNSHTHASAAVCRTTKKYWVSDRIRSRKRCIAIGMTRTSGIKVCESSGLPSNQPSVITNKFLLWGLFNLWASMHIGQKHILKRERGKKKQLILWLGLAWLRPKAST